MGINFSHSRIKDKYNFKKYFYIYNIPTNIKKNSIIDSQKLEEYIYSNNINKIIYFIYYFETYKNYFKNNINIMTKLH